MANLPTITGIHVESIVFPPSFKPPGATNTLFLGGAGVRGMEIQGKFVKLSGVGVYLDDKAIPTIAVKWKGKSAEELKDSVEFYTDIVTGPFEKCIQVAAIKPLVGAQISENFVMFWKALGTYTDADAYISDKLHQVFKDQMFPPGSSVLMTISSVGSLMISFLKDGIIPEVVIDEFENEKLGQAMIEMAIGKHSVSPEAKQCLASTLSNIMN